MLKLISMLLISVRGAPVPAPPSDQHLATGSNSSDLTSGLAPATLGGQTVRHLQVNEEVVWLHERDEPCTSENPCTAGQGDCNHDDDCAGGLTCFQRSAHQVAPPGTSFYSWDENIASGKDYCFDASPEVLLRRDDTPCPWDYCAYTNYKGHSACTPENPCTAGQGDCDGDDDCAGDLKCFQRSAGQAFPPALEYSKVSHLEGQGDYCYQPLVSSHFEVHTCPRTGSPPWESGKYSGECSGHTIGGGTNCETGTDGAIFFSDQWTATKLDNPGNDREPNDWDLYEVQTTDGGEYSLFAGSNDGWCFDEVRFYVPRTADQGFDCFKADLSKVNKCDGGNKCDRWGGDGDNCYSRVWVDGNCHTNSRYKFTGEDADGNERCYGESWCHDVAWFSWSSDFLQPCSYFSPSTLGVTAAADGR